jgi:hypothetical protein
LVGGIVVLILLESKRKTGAATTAPSAGLTNDPYATQLISLQSQIIDASGALGKTAGGSVGAAAGSAVSSGEQNVAKGLGATPLTDQQIYDLSHNAAQNGLVAGTTVGANASSAAGGAAGAGLFDFIAAWFSGAASSEFLRSGGVADRLNLPKWGG